MLFYETKGNALIVRLTGELDHSAATRIRSELDELIADTGARRLIFDVSNLAFMDSSGIGLIIGRYKLMTRRGGSVAVVGSNERIDRIFEMAGLYQLVDRLA
ncbi:MAG: anti-sigma factor antagonist [Clostridia bacterium]|nr:anti-sigma factor antagonist [Clostridia bacterium]